MVIPRIRAMLFTKMSAYGAFPMTRPRLALLAFAAFAVLATPAAAAGTGYGQIRNYLKCLDLRRSAGERMRYCHYMLVSHLLGFELTARTMIAMGTAYADTGDDAQALDWFGKSLDERRLSLAYYDRAAILARQGHNDAALADLDAAAQLQPDSAAILVRRGEVQHALGHSDRALADFDAALKLKPDFLPAQAARCTVRGDAGGCDTPALTQAAHLTALNRRADAAYRAGDDANAIAGFTDVLAADPDSAMALYLRGWAKERSGDKAGAAHDIHAAFVIDNDVDHKAMAFEPLSSA
jgi:tetratricopeptide (TPR) repeat protein